MKNPDFTSHRQTKNKHRKGNKPPSISTSTIPPSSRGSSLHGKSLVQNSLTLNYLYSLEYIQSTGDRTERKHGTTTRRGNRMGGLVGL